MGEFKILGAIIGIITWGFVSLMASIAISEGNIVILGGDSLCLLSVGNFLAFLLILMDWLGEKESEVDVVEVVEPSPQVISETQIISRAQDPNSSQSEVIKCPHCGYNNHRKRKSCKICLEPFV